MRGWGGTRCRRAGLWTDGRPQAGWHGCGPALGTREVPDGALRVAKTARLMMPVTDPQHASMQPQPTCQPLCPAWGVGPSLRRHPGARASPEKGLPRPAALHQNTRASPRPPQPGAGGGGHLRGTPEPRAGPRLTEPASRPALPHCQAPLPRPGVYGPVPGSCWDAAEGNAVTYRGGN